MCGNEYVTCTAILLNDFMFLNVVLKPLLNGFDLKSVTCHVFVSPLEVAVRLKFLFADHVRC